MKGNTAMFLRINGSIQGGGEIRSHNGSGWFSGSGRSPSHSAMIQDMTHILARRAHGRFAAVDGGANVGIEKQERAGPVVMPGRKRRLLSYVSCLL